MTDNGIGDDGAKAISEKMGVNKTLTSLDLSGEEELKENEKEQEMQRRMNDRQWDWR